MTTASGMPAGWSKTSITINFSASDDFSGVDYTQYSLDSGTTWTTANSVTIAASANHANDGIHTIEYRSADKAGNLETAKSCQVSIDTTGPTTAGKAVSGKRNHAVKLKYRITDKLSPKATAVTLTIKNAKGKIIKTFKLGTRATNAWLTVKWTPKAKGSYKYSITAKDLAGNKQSKVGSAKAIVK